LRTTETIKVNHISTALDDFFTYEVLVLRREEQRLADALSTLAEQPREVASSAAISSALRALNERMNGIELILNELERGSSDSTPYVV
jgi:hypothetical protein